MIKTSDILDEKDKRVRAHNKEVEFPISKEKKKLISIKALICNFTSFVV